MRFSRKALFVRAAGHKREGDGKRCAYLLRSARTQKLGLDLGVLLGDLDVLGHAPARRS